MIGGNGGGLQLQGGIPARKRKAGRGNLHPPARKLRKRRNGRRDSRLRRAEGAVHRGQPGPPIGDPLRGNKRAGVVSPRPALQCGATSAAAEAYLTPRRRAIGPAPDFA
jgi:hypothetical protein